MDRISFISEKENYELELREFICGLEGSVFNAISEIDSSNINTVLKVFVEDLRKIMKYFRKIFVREPRYEKVLLIDDYIFFSIQQKIMETLKKYEKYLDDDLKNKILELFEKNIEENSHDNSKNLGHYIYRHRLLKKYVHSSLFLNSTKKRDGKVTEHIAYGIAALITMAIISAVTVSYASQRTLKYIFLVAVAYAFKDRMKESFRGIFYEKMSKNIPDFITSVTTSSGEKICYIKEFFDIFTDKKLSKELINNRNRDHDIKRVEEDIIRYNKMIIPENGFVHKKFIRELTYINVKQFLGKMDDPEDKVFICDRQKNILEIISEKEYHLNMIIQVKQNKTLDFKSFQIVLDRNGLIKILEK
ncbi:MAG: hypothetical protein ACRC0V_11310 [Fusobacteriaceae bacterium]